MLLRLRNQNRRRQTDWSVSGMSAAAECAELRVLLSATPIDGTGNNLQNSEWGSVGEDLLRLANAEYADAISAVGGEGRPSARLISNFPATDCLRPEMSERTKTSN